MKLNWIIAGALALTLSAPSWAQDDLINKVKDNGGERGYQFETVVNHDATPVKDQGSSGTCWSYATSSFLESEMIRMGKDPVDISEMYTVRMTYIDKAEKYVRLHGNLNFGQGGALPDVLYVIDKYGAVPQQVYDGLVIGYDRNKHGEMEAVLRGIVDAVVDNKNGRISPVWKNTFADALNAYLGEEPESFEWAGKTYTPRSFADDVIGINPDEYVQFTSFTHHPLQEEVMIQVPDNWAWGKAYNIELDAMIETLDYALENGYTVSWATDVSEKGFSIKNGVAIVPKKKWADMTPEEIETAFDGGMVERQITPEIRQRDYDNYETTDDHGMHITGMAKDQNGKKFYIVKNSWSTKYGFDGYIYVSEAFVRYKTIGILLHREGVPKSVRKQIDL